MLLLVYLVARCNISKSILRDESWFWLTFVSFGCIILELILASKIDFGRSKFFLLYIRITFRGIIKYKSLSILTKSILTKLILSKINSTKIEQIKHYLFDWPKKKKIDNSVTWHELLYIIFGFTCLQLRTLSLSLSLSLWLPGSVLRSSISIHVCRQPTLHFPVSKSLSLFNFFFHCYLKPSLPIFEAFIQFSSKSRTLSRVRFS